jgi:hypothetical protein
VKTKTNLKTKIRLNMPKPNILFFVPSPRDIPEVRQPIVDILYPDHDVIWFKYFQELDAYQKARKYFLESERNYDYFCIIPDDLGINKEGIDLLLNELENPSLDLSKYDNQYPVLAGICNYSYVNSEQMTLVAASVSSTTSAYLLSFGQLEKMSDRIIKCAYIGFSCEFIHRSVMEKIDFKSHAALGMDNIFSDSLVKKKIPQYILKDARFVHYKGLSVLHKSSLSVNPDVIFVGVYKPYVIFHDSKRK